MGDFSFLLLSNTFGTWLIRPLIADNTVDPRSHLAATPKSKRLELTCLEKKPGKNDY